MSRQTTQHSKLGALIRSHRVTMGKVAGVTGINYITLSKYVNLHKAIIPKHAFLLADFFNCRPEDLYGLVDGVSTETQGSE